MGFARLADSALEPFAANTVKHMTDNAGFLTPRVPLTSITSAMNTFRANLAATLDGGRLATAKKNASRTALILLLRQQAAYVQSIAAMDLPLLLSSGFFSTKTDRTRIELPKVELKKILTPQSDMFRIVVKPVITAAGYELRYKNGTGDYIPAGMFTSSRRILLTAITPGATYSVQVRAVGGLTGYGDWSDAVSHMAI